MCVSARPLSPPRPASPLTVRFCFSVPQPFTAPPTNQSKFHEWTISPIFYSTLVTAETLGPTNTAQVVDLQANSGNIFTPAYAIYENGVPARVALFNFMTDPSGANTYTATIQITGATLASVQVKYLTAPSVAEKTNITWAGQGFGGPFESDGRLQGTEDVQTIQCSNNVCSVPVPAPAFALVFLSDTAFSEVNPAASAIPTFSTTTGKPGAAAATINPSVLATSNGQGGANGQIMLGSTSQSSTSGAGMLAVPWLSAVLAMAFGAAMVGRRMAL